MAMWDESELWALLRNECELSLGASTKIAKALHQWVLRHGHDMAAPQNAHPDYVPSFPPRSV